MVIDLQFNNLEGSLPPDIGFCFPQLVDFRISSNFFHGHVPFSISNLTQLQALVIHSNNFTGKFMFSAQNMPNLLGVDNANNFLGTGEEGDLNFVRTLVNCSQLQWLLCGFNNFGGVLPNFLGDLSTELRIIDFGHNQITGTIPSSGLFNLLNLERLELSSNQLTGSITLEIGKLAKLEYLNCRGNNLIGTIPYSIGNLSRLSELYLNKNDLQGVVPSSLGDCKNLLYLSLSQNNLKGSLPPHLFHSSMLVGLYLYQNQLHGTLPMVIEELNNLLNFYISDNAFFGEIPGNLGSCTSLVDLEMGGNFFTGSIPESFKTLTSLQYLNLSHNRLIGQIPDFLSNFSLIGLDLSFNDLEGEVPSHGVFANLSAMSVLENPKLCDGTFELHLPRCPARAATTRESRRRKMTLKVILIISIACLVMGVSIISWVYYILCSKRKRNKKSQGSSMRDSFWKVSYGMLLQATNRFSEANLVGRGRFGSVYKGVLGPESIVVAVKVMNLDNERASKSFMVECKALRNIRHRNLLKIITACSSADFQGNDFKALVYEFMPNGNLQQWIHLDQATDEQDCHQQSLSLLQRLNIAIDMACVLDYLHNSCQVPIIHCDLKPSNILLDNDMVAHVGDFGLARLCSQERTSYSSSIVVKGTIGYVPPEYGLGSMVSKEGDVYSYGIMLIEMMTAKKPTDILCEGGGLNLHMYAKSAFPHQLTKIIDPRLVDENEELPTIGNTIECIQSAIEVGVKCSVEPAQDRMSIQDTIRELQSVRNILLGSTNRQRNQLRGAY